MIRRFLLSTDKKFLFFRKFHMCLNLYSEAQLKCVCEMPE